MSMNQPNMQKAFNAAKQTEFHLNKGEESQKRFVINHWSPSTVYRNMPLIGRYFAVPLAMLFGNSEEEGAAGFADKIPEAILYLFTQMEENDVMDFFNLILTDAMYEGATVAGRVDEVFQDDPSGVIHLVAKVLEVNYMCFFKKGGLDGLLNMLVPMAMVEEQVYKS